MYAIGQTFKLRPGRYAEYRRAHDELWPELAEAMRACGVSMVIYHWHDRLFLYATAPTQEDFERSHRGPVAQRWAAYMASMMETHPDGTAIVEELEQAFAFGCFRTD
ncbi:MAG: L-rhamnose mutarotase [Candidatus Latescibacterota bacterium]